MGGLHRRLFPDFNSRPSARGDEKQQNSHFDILFQFTPLREGRHGNQPPEHQALRISIHAPPRGATMTAQSLRQLQTYFNSRPSARGDAIGKPTFVMSVFQFTPLREGRPPMRWRMRSMGQFQFTPLREGRRRATGKPDVLLISIHAPPRGATRWRSGTPPPSDFNSRPSARGDANGGGVWRKKYRISIHAPPRGATHTNQFCG